MSKPKWWVPFVRPPLVIANFIGRTVSKLTCKKSVSISGSTAAHRSPWLRPGSFVWLLSDCCVHTKQRVGLHLLFLRRFDTRHSCTVGISLTFADCESQVRSADSSLSLGVN